MAALLKAKASLGLVNAAFPGRVTTPDAGAEYTASVNGSWSQTCWTPAAGYVQLETAEQAAEALAIIKKTGCKFAIRTTGHNANVGFSSADSTGIVLELGKLKSRELTADGIARVGPGNTWGEIYTWLQEQGRSAIGGRQQEVGCAGFLLGGGLGAFPNLHGLGADNVKNFQVLLANGTFVDANADENPELYRALKGGGSNFGIVTRFDIETYPLIKTQWTINLYNPDDYINVIKATIKVQEAMEKDPKIGLFTNFNEGVIVVGLLYADVPEQRPAVFDEFSNLGSLIAAAAPTADGTLLDLTNVMAHGDGVGKRYCASATTRLSQEVYEGIYNLREEASKFLPPGAILHSTVQPFGTLGAKAGQDRGGNSLGVESVAQCWWVFTCEWKEGVDDAGAVQAVDFMANGAQDLARRSGEALDFMCMSFSSAPQKVLSSYGADNVENLKQVASRYDPDGIFQKLQHNGFLLRNSL